MERYQQLWNECLSIIKDNLTEAQYNTWFSPIVPAGFNGRDLILQIPSQFFYEYLEENFAEIIRLSIDRIIGRNTRLLYKIMVDHNNPVTDISIPANNTRNSDKLNDASVDLQAPAGAEMRDFDCLLNPKYTFDNFVEGESNKLARCAGLDIAAHPGKSVFNPLFIFGSPAVGKTHLANSIGIAIKQRYTKKRVIYISAHIFLLQYTDSIQTKKTNDFINFYQSIDVLIIDDIQELIGKSKTQNTFFHIFNHLLLIGKQIIICCDREPGKLEGMEERLLTRFKMGLIVEIEKPNLELRRKILEHKIYQDGLKISPEVVDYVAEQVTSNVRDLEGTLTSLLAHSTFLNAEINLDLARRIVGTVVKEDNTNDEQRMQRIYDIVCTQYDVNAEAIKSKSRERHLSEARQVAMYLARTQTEISLATIGLLFGKRDHSTVLYACRIIRNMMDVDPSFCERVRKMERKVNE